MRILPVPPGGHLSPEAKQQVAVLFEAILPGTATAPGAADAGAAEFLDVLLSADEDLFYEVPAWRRTYAAALPALDVVARERFGHPLGELPEGDARELVAALAAGDLPGLPEGVDARRLFATLRNHCIEGCFADPRWGGNRDEAMWRWLGYGRPPEGPDIATRAEGPDSTAGADPGAEAEVVPDGVMIVASTTELTLTVSEAGR
jgi:gluconate 2-dehydrogenase gamma chain